MAGHIQCTSPPLQQAAWKAASYGRSWGGFLPFKGLRRSLHFNLIHFEVQLWISPAHVSTRWRWWPVFLIHCQHSHQPKRHCWVSFYGFEVFGEGRLTVFFICQRKTAINKFSELFFLNFLVHLIKRSLWKQLHPLSCMSTCGAATSGPLNTLELESSSVWCGTLCKRSLNRIIKNGVYWAWPQNRVI